MKIQIDHCEVVFNLDRALKECCKCNICDLLQKLFKEVEEEILKNFYYHAHKKLNSLMLEDDSVKSINKIVKQFKEYMMKHMRKYSISFYICFSAFNNNDWKQYLSLILLNKRYLIDEK